MARKWRMFLLLLSAFTAVGITYHSLSLTYISDVFFTLPLSQTDAPINKLCGGHYQTRQMIAITHVSADAKGRIYVAGFKDKKPRLVVISPNGGIEEAFYICLKSGGYLNFCGPIAVSPSGNNIWVVCIHIDPIRNWWEERIVVYGKQKEIVAEWQHIGEDIDFLWTSGEDAAYGVTVDRIVYSFKIGRAEPYQFSIPFYFPFFKDGKFWFIEPLEHITKVLGKHENGKGWVGIVTYTQNEETKLVRKIKFPFAGSIHWIDGQGNLYIYRWGHYSIRLPNFLTAIPFLIRILKAFGISEGVLKPIPPKILIFSPKGKLLDVIPLFVVVRPRKGEKLRYGQLVKVDETGIYLEVERVSEPREYRIVRIVKKPRWKVWWERLMKGNALYSKVCW